MPLARLRVKNVSCCHRGNTHGSSRINVAAHSPTRSAASILGKILGPNCKLAFRKSESGSKVVHISASKRSWMRDSDYLRRISATEGIRIMGVYVRQSTGLGQ